MSENGGESMFTGNKDSGRPQGAPPATDILTSIEEDLNAALLAPTSDSSAYDDDDNESRSVQERYRRIVRQLRRLRKFGDYLAYSTLCTMLLVIPVILYRTLSNRELDKAAFKSARVMVLGTVVLSARLVYLHLTHWYMPEVQKYVVRILWMVPIYAVQSYLSLIFKDSRIYIDCLRDLYEAYVICSFVYYLIAILGGQDSLVQILQEKEGSGLGKHGFPFRLILTTWDRGVDFMLQCKHGVLQYVVFKIIAVIITFSCESAGMYGEGKFDWRVAYPYMCFFQNISVMYALYCLVMLYHAIQEELRHPVNWRPLGKFLCVKGVVFFTWWQGVLIFYLREHGIIGNMGSWSSAEVANGLIDYCIVVEMIGFAIAHSYTFSYKEYLPSSLPTMPDAGALQRAESSGSAYRPPATLNQPMGFRDAFWSSTVPRETIRDIQSLRTGLGGERRVVQDVEESPPTSNLQGVTMSQIEVSPEESSTGASGREALHVDQ